MLAAIFLAGTVEEAFGSKATEFILSYLAIRSLVLLLYVRSAKYVASARTNLQLYLASYVPSTLLWLVSLGFTGTIHYSLCVLAMTIELIVPIIGSRWLARTPVHPSHLPERFGLLTLIVLGEAIVSVAVRTENTNFGQTLPLLAAIGGFAIAACLWWLYFSFLESMVVIRGIRSVHLYNYGHLPILLGLVTVAVGVDRTIAQIAQPVVETETRWALCGGISLYMSSIMAIAVFSCHNRITIPSIIVVVFTLLLAAFGILPPIVLEALVLGILVIKVRTDILRVSNHHSPVELLDNQSKS
jgi:low temperature requirement protein LtrA